MSKIIRLGRKKNARRGANHLQRLAHRRALPRNLFRGLGGLSWRRSALLLLVLSMIGMSGYGLRKGLQAYRDGRILMVNRIVVDGNRHWDSSRLLERAGLEVGAKLPGISLRSARLALQQLPGIQAVAVRSSLDGELRIEVKEEEVLAQRRCLARAFGSVEGRTGAWEGLTLSGAWMPLRGAEPDAPVIDARDAVGRGGAAVVLAHFLAGARANYPRLFGSFSQISVRGPDEADIYWRDGRFKARVDYTNMSLNSLELLSELLEHEQASWTPGSTVDLRVEGYAYVL